MVTTLAEILPHAARRHKDRIAVIVDDRQFSFTQLDSMSNRVANGLVTSGINPGDRVGLYGPNSWEWLVCYYGIVKTGAVVNPLNTMLTPDEVRYSVTDAGARAVLASSDKASTVLDGRAHGRGSNRQRIATLPCVWKLRVQRVDDGRLNADPHSALQ